MPDIEITDHLGNAIPAVKIDLSEPSSFLPYARAEVLHLAVAPDFEELAPEKLSTAAAKPISFDLALQHEFALGGTTPEINLTPGLKASLQANTTKGSDLLQDHPFGSGRAGARPDRVSGDQFSGLSRLGRERLGGRSHVRLRCQANHIPRLLEGVSARRR